MSYPKTALLYYQHTNKESAELGYGSTSAKDYLRSLEPHFADL